MQDKPKRQWLPVHGVVLFDKPLGWSSNDAVQRVRRVFSAEKGGHTGTLDPLATGLLPIALGEASKFSADLLDADKTYETEVCLGFVSDTGDAEGALTQLGSEQAVRQITRAQVEQVLNAFRGPQKQTPPMYSALKKDGKALYEYARQGIEIAREQRDIVIHALECTALDGPRLRLRVTCSKGTYIRVLGQDIAQALGVGGHLTQLRRTAVGALNIEHAVTFEQLNADPSAGLLPVDTLLQTLPRMMLSPEMAARFMHGQRLPTGAQTISGKVRVYDNTERLLGCGFLNNDGAGNSLLVPERLIRVPT